MPIMSLEVHLLAELRQAWKRSFAVPALEAGKAIVVHQEAVQKPTAVLHHPREDRVVDLDLLHVEVESLSDGKTKCSHLCEEGLMEALNGPLAL